VRCGLITLTGPSGIGASIIARLSAEYIALRGGCSVFQDGVYCVNMRRHGNLSVVEAVVAATLGPSATGTKLRKSRDES